MADTMSLWLLTSLKPNLKCQKPDKALYHPSSPPSTKVCCIHFPLLLFSTVNNLGVNNILLWNHPKSFQEDLHFWGSGDTPSFGFKCTFACNAWDKKESWNWSGGQELWPYVASYPGRSKCWWSRGVAGADRKSHPCSQQEQWQALKNDPVTTK